MYKNKYLKYKDKYKINKLKKIVDIIYKMKEEFKLNDELIDNLYNIFLVIQSSEMNEIDSCIEKKLNYIFYFIAFLLDKHSIEGPLVYSNKIYSNVIMSAIPYSCSDLEILVNKENINMIISLRENNELYQYCKNIKNPPIFWRYLIPDFGYQDPQNFKALIDNIYNYTENSNEKKKVLIHCLGGHGRTGSVACSLIALKFFLLNNNIKNLLIAFENKHFKLNHSTEPNVPLNLLENKKNIDEFIRNISFLIFKLSQIYVMSSLRIHRETDREQTRPNPHQMLVPETPAQNDMVINVIMDYIHDYLNNEMFLNPDTQTIDKCNDNEIVNFMGNRAWLCASNIDTFEKKKKEHDNITLFS
jgi:protein-tyrosine phosphatase